MNKTIVTLSVLIGFLSNAVEFKCFDYTESLTVGPTVRPMIIIRDKEGYVNKVDIVPLNEKAEIALASFHEGDRICLKGRKTREAPAYMAYSIRRE